MKENKNLIIGLVVAFVISLALSLFFAAPTFKNKELKQFDITQYKGSAGEITKYAEQGEQIMWTNSMFSGMPAYLISIVYKTNISSFARAALIGWLPHPAGMIFLLIMSFYLMLLCLKVDPWLSLGGAVAFAFSSYFIIILAAGHNNKVLAVAFLPVLFGGLYYTFRRNPFIGAAIFAGAMALEVVSNHPQMTYYFGFFAAAFVLVEFIGALINGTFKKFALGFSMIVLATFLALGVNYNNLNLVNGYGKFSSRSKSELTLNQENKTSGLDRDYITGWSNGVAETFSLLIPNFKGGETGAIGEMHKDALKNVNGQMKQMVAQTNAYWGDQPGVGGPVYVGSFILVLFVFALFYVKDRMKWAVLAVTIFVVMLSWGHNFPLLTDFMINHFPLYTKFRAVASVLVIAQLTIPLLALYALSRMASTGNMNDKAVIFGKPLPLTWLHIFLGVAGTFALITLVFALAPAAFTTLFATGEADGLTQQLQSSNVDSGIINELLGAIESARASILSSDAWRSLLFIVLGTALIYAQAKFKLNTYIVAGLFFVITTADLVSVSRRYLNDNNFVAAKKNKDAPIPKTASDEYILADADLHHRTANLSVSTFNDATTSFYHKSIGGYHGAKLKIYQELIEYVLSDELMNIQRGLQTAPTLAAFDSIMAKAPGLNMLNTRYFILGPQGQGAVIRNNSALGNAWFPSQIIPVENADEEIIRLKTLDAASQVLVRKQYADMFAGIASQPDSISTVKLTSYHPEKLVYDVNAASDKVMVFSEIYYPDGWVATIDGQETPIARANYVLRAIRVPAGKHTVELNFISSFKSGEKVSLIFSIALCAFIVLLLFSKKIKFMKNLAGNDE